MRLFPLIALFFALLLPAPRVLAQVENVGFIRFVNAVGMKGNLDIRLAGQSVRKGGFPAGGVTGGVGLKQGSYNFSFEHPACKGLKKGMQVDPQTTTTWLVVCEKIEKKEDGRPDEFRLVLRPLKPRASNNRASLDIVSASQLPMLRLLAFFNKKRHGKDIFLQPGESQNLPLPGPGEVLLGAGKVQVLRLIIEDPTHWAVILIDDPAVKGGLRAVYFLNEPLQVAG